MKYDFDAVHNRKNTSSLKYDFAEKLGRRADILPLWVADTDFKLPFEAEEALVRLARHGIFGYSEPGDGYFEALQAWFRDRFNYETKEEHTVLTPGVVFALAAAVRAFTEKGEAVLIQKPVYYPFSEVILDNDRKLVNNPLVYENGAYSIDFEDFERKIIDNSVKLFILCSPHNPVGRVWTRDELVKLGEICLKHGCAVVSDEIHCDFVYAPHKHGVFAAICPEFAENSVICTAPSKTFNLAGLQNANIFIKNPELLGKFQKQVAAAGYSQVGIPGLVAAEYCYRYGAEWLGELLAYLSENIRVTKEFAERIGARYIKTEGTYLVWIDFSPLGFSDKELRRKIQDEAGVWLDGGPIFGENGSGFQRINVACPIILLKEALSKMERVFTK